MVLADMARYMIVNLYVVSIGLYGHRYYLCIECAQGAADKGYRMFTDKIYHGASGCEWCGEGCNVPYDSDEYGEKYRGE